MSRSSAPTAPSRTRPSRATSGIPCARCRFPRSRTCFARWNPVMPTSASCRSRIPRRERCATHSICSCPHRSRSAARWNLPYDTTCSAACAHSWTFVGSALMNRRWRNVARRSTGSCPASSRLQYQATPKARDGRVTNPAQKSWATWRVSMASGKLQVGQRLAHSWAEWPSRCQGKSWLPVLGCLW